MTMNLLDMYNADNSGGLGKPDVAGVDDIIAMEGGIDNVLGKDNEDTDKKDTTPEETKTEEKTSETPDATEEKTSEGDKKSSEGINTDNENAIDNQEEKDTIATGNNKDGDIVEENNVDLDNIIKKIETEDINMDLVKELEKEQIYRKELEAKNEVYKSELEKYRERLAALEAQDGNIIIPAKLKGLVKIYEKFNNDGDETSKSVVIDKLAGLLTELSGKDVYSFINSFDKTKDLANLENNNNSGIISPNKTEDDSDLDPKAIKEFGLEVI